MPEPGGGEKKGGLYIKKGKPFNADNISPDRLKEVAERSGIDFVLDSDGQHTTATPERYVVVPGEKKKTP